MALWKVLGWAIVSALLVLAVLLGTGILSLTMKMGCTVLGPLVPSLLQFPTVVPHSRVLWCVTILAPSRLGVLLVIPTSALRRTPAKFVWVHRQISLIEPPTVLVLGSPR